MFDKNEYKSIMMKCDKTTLRLTNEILWTNNTISNRVEKMKIVQAIINQRIKEGSNI